MAYVRKTRDEYSIEGLYYGEWDTECYCDDYADARVQLQSYRENCPEMAFRIAKHRVKIEHETSRGIREY